MIAIDILMAVKRVLLLIPIFAVLNILSEPYKVYSQPLDAQCGIASPVIDFVVAKIKKSKLVNLQALTCKDLREIIVVDPMKLELTTGRKQGESVLCLGISRENPCRYVIAKINPGEDPTSTLANIFSVVSRDSNVPLNETVERLFIRPSALIR